MEGNPRIIRDLGVESCDEPPLDISTASKSAPKSATKTAPKSENFQSRKILYSTRNDEIGSRSRARRG